jgi:EAL domain-containing protein (putative c-di-GMP-specific phosphodiesterase class I)
MAEDQRLARDLRFAAARGEITARFQAQVDVRNGLVVALEALGRWHHPRRGVILPGEFVALAEVGGAINAVGDVMIEAACRYGAALAAAGRRIEIAVNVAAGQLTQLRFAERVLRHIETSGLPTALLTLELTESRPTPPSAVRALAGVRAIGVGVSVDDVRTVEEATARTESLPVTELKVDRSVIQRLPDDGGGATRLLGFARDRGLQTVAEGVETKRQWEAVRELGFDRAQGYLFGHPLPPQRMTARLAAATVVPTAQSEL